MKALCITSAENLSSTTSRTFSLHPTIPEKCYLRYPIRLALIDLEAAPGWFREQAKDHWTAEHVRTKAGTQGHAAPNEIPLRNTVMQAV